jgi:hypothetical protein
VTICKDEALPKEQPMPRQFNFDFNGCGESFWFFIGKWNMRRFGSGQYEMMCALHRFLPIQ